MIKVTVELSETVMTNTTQNPNPNPCRPRVRPVLLVSRDRTREGRVCGGSNKVYRGSAACTDYSTKL